MAWGETLFMTWVGYWPNGGKHEEDEEQCRPALTVMAEYVVETDIITVIPTFYNFQDIRTFYTVNTTQTFKVHIEFYKFFFKLLQQQHKVVFKDNNFDFSF